jgi:hypothetical protein
MREMGLRLPSIREGGASDYRGSRRGQTQASEKQLLSTP